MNYYFFPYDEALRSVGQMATLWHKYSLPYLPIPCVFFGGTFWDQIFWSRIPGMKTFDPGQTMSIGGIPSDQWVGEPQKHRIHGTGICTYIKNTKHRNQPNVGKYTSPMDCMAMTLLCKLN